MSETFDVFDEMEKLNWSDLNEVRWFFSAVVRNGYWSPDVGEGLMNVALQHQSREDVDEALRLAFLGREA